MTLFARRLVVVFAFFALAAARGADLPGRLADSHRIVFLGDSITYAGTYVDFIQQAIREVDPSWHGFIVDLGLPSETVSGLSEPGHAGGKFPRPDLHERLERVLAQTRPDMVIACYGMNDGIYHPFSADRFDAFKAGMTWMHDRIVAAHARIIHVTPPIFDPLPIHDRTLPAGLSAYSKPFVGYDDVLARYSAWLIEQRTAGWTVIDVHTPMAAALVARRNTEPSFHFAKDGVHPDRLGHAIIAQSVLTGLGFPTAIADEPMRLVRSPETDAFKLIRTQRKLLSDAWLTATGHKRPGMAKGEPLPKAEADAATLDAEIAVALAKP